MAEPKKSVSLDGVDLDARKHYRRILESDEAKKRLNQTIRAIRILRDQYEDKITKGDSWRSTYKLPELFGICERKIADLVDNLPEVQIESDFFDSYNMAVPASATLEHFQFLANDRYVKVQAMSESVWYGTGIKWDGIANIVREITPVDSKNPEMFLKKGKEKKISMYYGLAPKTIDVRDAFPDPAATQDHDETGCKGMRWFYHRTIFSEDALEEQFPEEIFDLKDLKPVFWDQVAMYGIPRDLTTHESNEKPGTEKQYYVVFEGISVDDDSHVFICNGRVIYEGANPYAHKQIPAHFYYNYKRDDSIWGISEAEIHASFIFIKETLVNLMIDNAKLSQQPVIAISGDVNFDPDENELEPGALFTLQGLNGGKIGDAIQPLQFSSSVEPARAVKEIIEDLQIQVSGDDIRSLFSSPNELATHTLAKRDALKKRIRKNVMENTIRTERNSAMQQFSNICQFLARPYQDLNGKWKHRIIYVKDYKIDQRVASSKPEFSPVNGYQGTFKLNEKTLNPEYISFKVIEKTEDSVKKEQELQALQWWMQTIFSLAQARPEIMQNTDLELLAKSAGTRFTGIDVESIFNSASRILDGMDEMDYTIQQIALLIKPIITPDGNNIRRLERFRKFEKTKEYELLPKPSKEIFKETIIDIVKAIRAEKDQPFADFVRKRGMGNAGQASQQGAMGQPTQASGVTVSRPNQPNNQPEAVPQPVGGGVSAG